ncbi:hypothetical protein Tco_1048928 [Tanacetum coccineum]
MQLKYQNLKESFGNNTSPLARDVPDQSKKRKLVKESSKAPSLAKRPKAEVDMQKAVEESLKDVHAAHQGPLLLVVIREPKFGKFQPLPKVHGKGKEKVGEEQVAQVLLNLQTLIKKSPANQFIFQSVLSTLRCSSLRTASTAAKHCQGDSLEFYLITGKKCEHAGLKMMISKKAQRSHKSKEQSSKITTCSTMTDHEESKDYEPESKINS